MRRLLLFLTLLIGGLALLAWGVSVGVQETTRSWTEKDIRLRAQLALTGARQALISSWENPRALRALLTEIASDERILGASACTADLRQLARTDAYPSSLGCRELELGARAGHLPALSSTVWDTVTSLPGGRVHVSALPVDSGGRALGFVVLVHDLSYVERREAKTRLFLLYAFTILAVTASGATVLAARLSWRGWSQELRTVLRGDARRPEFRPLLRDVSDLVDRILAERESDRESGDWTPQRLKQTLNRYLHGERLLVLANREPYLHERTPDGGIRVVHPASGLVTALEPVVRACSGVWIAHGSGSADRETADRDGRLRVPPGEDSYVLRRIWLSEEDERGYYYGFSNEGLWPLCHIAHERPIFRGQDWERYRAVNRRFADALVSEADTDDPIVLVQDYHLALVPRLVRERLPRASVIAFWHIPWPNAERFAICPWRGELLEGLLGASIVGFHTQSHCNNFLDSVDRLLEARIDREHNAVVQRGRSTLVRPYPISLEWPVSWTRNLEPAAECRRTVRRELGLAEDALIGLGVDRLDYTKGIEERFLAVERLLEREPALRGRFTFVQLAAPSRTAIRRYRDLNERVEILAQRINARFGSAAYRPIILRRAHHEHPAVFRHYRAADLLYVSSLHDGMNLVAKEFVAARDDERGVLVLSELTGAARELTEALIVNPYDLEAASTALRTALAMSAGEQRERMRSMRRYLAEFNVHRWAGRMLVDAARLRQRERLTGRISARGEDSSFRPVA